MKEVLIWLALAGMTGATAFGQGDDRLVGVWDGHDDVQTVKLLFRSGGRYQLDSKSTDPILDLSSTERGWYQVAGETLTLIAYDYLVKPDPRPYQMEITGSSLSLTSADFGQTQ